VDFQALARNIEADVIEWRRHLHRNPELSGQEYDTARFVAEILEKTGIEDVRHVGDTGVTGLIRGRGPGRVVALRADMDALPGDEKTGLPFSSERPGAAHMCGHDVHTAILLGVAKVLHDARGEFDGAVRLVFQPAEEGLGGAESMIAGGVLENPKVDAIAALHLWPELPPGTVGIRDGALTAATDGVIVEFTGSQGHAAHPHKCVDPVVTAGQFLANVQAVVAREIAPLDAAVLTFGKIAGGHAGNIIPEKVVIEGTIRTLSPETRKKMAAAVERFAKSTADGMRASVAVTIRRGVPPLISDPRLVALFAESVRNLLGPDRLAALPTPSMGGEDFALYLEHVPGVFFRLGVQRPGAPFHPLHSPQFDPDESAFATGVAAMSRFAADFLARGF
jgi:amidohydrolase